MAIDLKLPAPSEPVARRFRIQKDISDAFDLYMKAAQESAPGVEEGLVLERILEAHMRQDKGFQAWLDENGYNSGVAKRKRKKNPTAQRSVKEAAGA